MARFQQLSMFFPMWNEEGYVRAAIDAARDACEALVEQGEISTFELLIINDASTDRTGAIADALALEDPRVRVIHHAENRKLGGGIKTGLAHARGDVVVYSDADLPFDLAELAKACRLMRIYRADVVSAYRHDRTSEGFRRGLYSVVYNWLIRGLFGIHVRDVNFAFKVFHRRVLNHVTPISEGSFIDAELLIRAHRLGFRIIQFGVDYFPRTRGTSTLSSPATIMKILSELVQLFSSLRQVRPLEASVLAFPGEDPAARDRADATVVPPSQRQG